MFNNEYDQKIKAEVMAINKRYIKHAKNTGGALGRPIGCGLCGSRPAVGRPEDDYVVMTGIKSPSPAMAEALRTTDRKPALRAFAYTKELAKQKKQPRVIDEKGYTKPNKGGAQRAVSPWILHVKDYASKHNMSYRDSLKDPGCKASYSKVSAPTSEPALKKSKAKHVPPVATRAPRAPSKWIAHVKDFAKRNNVSYGCALSMPECKEEYRNPKPVEAPPKKKRLIRKNKL